MEIQGLPKAASAINDIFSQKGFSGLLKSLIPATIVQVQAFCVHQDTMSHMFQKSENFGERRGKGGLRQFSHSKNSSEV